MISCLQLQPIHICNCEMKLALNLSYKHSYDCFEGLMCGDGVVTLSTSISLISLNQRYQVHVSFLDIIFENISLSVLIEIII